MWDQPPDNFQYILFERVNPEHNEDRFYYVAWLPQLFGGYGVVRLYGRKGHQQRLLPPAIFDDINAAWSLIKQIITTRLNRGYRIVSPPEYQQPAAPAAERSQLMFTHTQKEQPRMPDDNFRPPWLLPPSPQTFHLVRMATNHHVELDVSELAKLMTALDHMIKTYKRDPHGQAIVDEYTNLLKKLQLV
ncbi:MAG: WGR domain-containing protein [Anaerolineae bacterium]|nr:WGR domain-containing protein [Anaerolineae bacterium]